MEPVEFRRRLHAHPELSFKEHDTAAFIEQQLDELGIEHRRIASTGVVARIKGRKTPEGDRRAAVLRADIDALPVTERNDCDLHSQNEGVMHACGHDMHAAVLFGVLFSVMLYGEQIGLRLVMGFALIFVAIVVSETFPLKRREPQGEDAPSQVTS